MSTFHEGEIAVQERAGVKMMANRVGSGIHPVISDAAIDFLQQQPFIIIASRDSKQQVWASLLVGLPGFLSVIAPGTLLIGAQPRPDDPLADHLQQGSALGLIAIQFAPRLRMRLNGTLARHTAEGLYIHAQEVYGNCQKYIQARPVTGVGSAAATAGQSGRTRRHTALTPQQQSWIARADTFFIASAHPEGGADASHRGGNPGFIQVVDEQRITFPDYSGNMMFNTLGNIAVNPSAGLLFLDFETGHTLQLTGHAAVIWDKDQIAAFPGAQRLVTFEIHEIIERDGGSGLRFGTPEYSRFNPQLTR